MKKLSSFLLITVFAFTPVLAKDLALKFQGTATADVLSMAAQAAIDNFKNNGLVFIQDDFACFEAPLFDLSTGTEVGVGIDCLRPVPVNSGLEIEAFTFFLLPGGNLVNHGLTSAQPFFPGVGDAMGAVTHMTGSIPPGVPGGVEAATGRFGHWVGAQVRLSGAVDLSVEGQIFFSCIFVIKEP